MDGPAIIRPSIPDTVLFLAGLIGLICLVFA
jgi:hypothetical protein